jgi:hypothetical protein
MARLLFALVIALCSLAVELSAATFTLYDSTLGTRLDQQGWDYRADNGTLFVPPIAATNTFSGGVTLLNTNGAGQDRAGYYRGPAPFLPPLPTTLDASLGYQLDFTARVPTESHTSLNRAGFNVIALSQDGFGIELGFWTDRISAQQFTAPSTFIFAENVSFDNASTGLKNYSLQILGSNYTLLANGNPILGGPLRNYSAFGFPYNQPNFVFFGDNTTSAQGISEIGSVQLTTPIPEPSTMFLLMGAVVVGGAMFLLRCKNNPPLQPVTVTTKH